MAINFVFFALEADRDGAWPALGALWRRFWSVYLDGSGDHALLDAAAPWLAWRALVVASPIFYPHLAGAARDRLLGWIEEVLDAPRLQLESADAVFG
jgi:1,6-anhydro-N-acetylmuramate kinase